MTMYEIIDQEQIACIVPAIAGTQASVGLLLESSSVDLLIVLTLKPSTKV